MTKPVHFWCHARNTTQFTYFHTDKLRNSFFPFYVQKTELFLRCFVNYFWFNNVYHLNWFSFHCSLLFTVSSPLLSLSNLCYSYDFHYQRIKRLLLLSQLLLPRSAKFACHSLDYFWWVILFKLFFAWKWMTTVR